MHAANIILKTIRLLQNIQLALTGSDEITVATTKNAATKYEEGYTTKNSTYN